MRTHFGAVCPRSALRAVAPEAGRCFESSPLKGGHRLEERLGVLKGYPLSVHPHMYTYIDIHSPPIGYYNYTQPLLEQTPHLGVFPIMQALLGLGSSGRNHAGRLNKSGRCAVLAGAGSKLLAPLFGHGAL